ncbi:MAG: hypothetical protein HQK49_06585 [Oligoflexia bacterium]|nr:hypothetical protein [Oligoflexia bacterium]
MRFNILKHILSILSILSIVSIISILQIGIVNADYIGAGKPPTMGQKIIVRGIFFSNSDNLSSKYQIKTTDGKIYSLIFDEKNISAAPEWSFKLSTEKGYDLPPLRAYWFERTNVVIDGRLISNESSNIIEVIKIRPDLQDPALVKSKIKNITGILNVKYVIKNGTPTPQFTININNEGQVYPLVPAGMSDYGIFNEMSDDYYGEVPYLLTAGKLSYADELGIVHKIIYDDDFLSLVGQKITIMGEIILVQSDIGEMENSIRVYDYATDANISSTSPITSGPTAAFKTATGVLNITGKTEEELSLFLKNPLLYQNTNLPNGIDILTNYPLDFLKKNNQSNIKVKYFETLVTDKDVTLPALKVLNVINVKKSKKVTGIFHVIPSAINESEDIIFDWFIEVNDEMISFSLESYLNGISFEYNQICKKFGISRIEDLDGKKITIEAQDNPFGENSERHFFSKRLMLFDIVAVADNSSLPLPPPLAETSNVFTGKLDINVIDYSETDDQIVNSIYVLTQAQENESYQLIMNKMIIKELLEKYKLTNVEQLLGNNIIVKGDVYSAPEELGVKKSIVVKNITIDNDRWVSKSVSLKGKIIINNGMESSEKYAGSVENYPTLLGKYNITRGEYFYANDGSKYKIVHKEDSIIKTSSNVNTNANLPSITWTPYLANNYVTINGTISKNNYLIIDFIDTEIADIKKTMNKFTGTIRVISMMEDKRSSHYAFWIDNGSELTRVRFSKRIVETLPSDFIEQMSPDDQQQRPIPPISRPSKRRTYEFYSENSLGNKYIVDKIDEDLLKRLMIKHPVELDGKSVTLEGIKTTDDKLSVIRITDVKINGNSIPNLTPNLNANGKLEGNFRSLFDEEGNLLFGLEVTQGSKKEFVPFYTSPNEEKTLINEYQTRFEDGSLADSLLLDKSTIILQGHFFNVGSRALNRAELIKAIKIKKFEKIKKRNTDKKYIFSEGILNNPSNSANGEYKFFDIRTTNGTLKVAYNLKVNNQIREDLINKFIGKNVTIKGVEVDQLSQLSNDLTVNTKNKIIKIVKLYEGNLVKINGQLKVEYSLGSPIRYTVIENGISYLLKIKTTKFEYKNMLEKFQAKELFQLENMNLSLEGFKNKSENDSEKNVFEIVRINSASETTDSKTIAPIVKKGFLNISYQLSVKDNDKNSNELVATYGLLDIAEDSKLKAVVINPEIIKSQISPFEISDLNGVFVTVKGVESKLGFRIDQISFDPNLAKKNIKEISGTYLKSKKQIVANNISDLSYMIFTLDNISKTKGSLILSPFIFEKYINEIHRNDESLNLYSIKNREVIKAKAVEINISSDISSANGLAQKVMLFR